jgi:riboflavin kinase/FMN adenylyltransferase
VPEVYIYDFDKNIYDKKITVNVLEKIRKEEKFSSSEELINQMNKDKEAGMKIFNEINNSRNLSTFKN